MDINAFSEENFFPKHWINNVFSQEKSTGDNKGPVEMLINQIEQHIERINSSIEENCQKMTNTIPEIVEEIYSIKQRALTVKEQMSDLKEEIKNIEKNSEGTVGKVAKIDRLKGVLENAKQALHEADNWSILASDIEESFDRGNVEEIISKLISMQQSLSVLSNTDDYEDKKMQLEGLKNRLEANVSPIIVKAFTTSNLEEAIKYAKVFSDIERLPHLLKYYVKCQKGSLCQYWKTLVDSDQDLNLTEQLRSLYDMLLDNWQKQLKWCSEVFTQVNLTELMIELYSDVLVTLDPSLTSCMDIALKQQSQPFLLLLEFYQISSQFQQNLESLYIFNNESEYKPNWYRVEKAVYFPYVQFASKYSTLERQLLDNYLWEQFSKIDSQNDVADIIRNINLTIPDVINIAKEAENRCIRFTRGCTLDGLIVALKGFFLKYIDKYKDICARLSKQISEKENWHLLKSCLSFQQTVGELLNEMRKLDSFVTKSLKTHKSDPEARKFSLLILNNAAQKEYENLLRTVCDDPSYSVLSNVIQVLEKLSHNVHQVTYKVLFQPIIFYLNSTKSTWDKLNKQEDRDLPDYSYSPLEYITQIGEYLITLPQHLEPFLSQDNVALNSVNKILHQEVENIGMAEKTTYAGILLGLIAVGACSSYSDHILNIRELSTSTARQLAADINYLGNVLEEIEVGLPENLQNILQLLRFSAEEYQTKSIGFSPKLVAAIRQMRKIPST